MDIVGMRFPRLKNLPKISPWVPVWGFHGEENPHPKTLVINDLGGNFPRWGKNENFPHDAFFALPLFFLMEELIDEVLQHALGGFGFDFDLDHVSTIFSRFFQGGGWTPRGETFLFQVFEKTAHQGFFDVKGEDGLLMSGRDKNDGRHKDEKFKIAGC